MDWQDNSAVAYTFQLLGVDRVESAESFPAWKKAVSGVIVE
jgi:hypothetical protein